MDPKVQAYYNFFRQQQTGGELAVFRGASQYGNGIGDILRGFFSRVFPVVLRGATSFLGAASRAADSGASPLDSVKAGLQPGAAGLMSGALDAFQRHQSGSGRKRKNIKQKVYKGYKKAKLKHSNLQNLNYNF
jgi:hypothetical protein